MRVGGREGSLPAWRPVAEMQWRHVVCLGRQVMQCPGWSWCPAGHGVAGLVAPC